jgi:predicted nicotinamide N-methyase
MGSEEQPENSSEDILSSALSTMYGYEPVTFSSAGSITDLTIPVIKDPKNGDSLGLAIFTENIRVVIRTPDTSPSNWSLHATSIWSAAMYLAHHTELLNLAELYPEIPLSLSILELGAGAGLPGILLAKLYPRAKVVVSDYPDDKLIATLSENAATNCPKGNCLAVPHFWGRDPSPLMAHAPFGFDCVIAADTIWNSSLHVAIIETVTRTLKRTEKSRAHFVAGFHTGRYTIAAVLNAIGGDTYFPTQLEVESIKEHEVNGSARRDWDVDREDSEDERERRAWVVWIVVKWRANNNSGKA